VRWCLSTTTCCERAAARGRRRASAAAVRAAAGVWVAGAWGLGATHRENRQGRVGRAAAAEAWPVCCEL
jgi:hypothetical protein